MAGVLLVLGLIAAGIYTGAWGFYLAAGVLGILYFLFMFLIIGIIAAAKGEITKVNNRRPRLF